VAHHSVRSSYKQLATRLNRCAQGAPDSELLLKILEILLGEREAELVSLLPVRPFTVETASRAWKLPPAEARRVLERLASRAILLDLEDSGEPLYVLPPPMAGFFEFSMMRIRDDIDQKTLAELFFQYLNVEEDFIKDLFGRGETQLGRVFVQEAVIPQELSLQVLDYERASWVARSASHIGVGICYCRHKMEHVGRACDAPRDICMTFNGTASSLIRHGVARRVDASECLDLLEQAQGHGLVQFGENIQQRVNFICNCCGCCCEAMLAARKLGFLRPVHTTNFIAEIDSARCSGCGECVEACPVAAISVKPKGEPPHPKRKLALRHEASCLGCGVCARACPHDRIRMRAREERVITPVDSVHRAVTMAIERGTLPNLIFDNQAHRSHRAMAAILGVILRLPPLKQAMASRQLQSRYLEALLRNRFVRRITHPESAVAAP
jgi:Na+-translocating ferredoxin:NAD+ oxidoreductase RNF subunit RnfB